MSTFVVLEHSGGKWNRISFEALEAARLLGEPVTAVVMGRDIAEMARQVTTRAVEQVIAVDHQLLESYTPDAYTAALEQLISARKPDVVIFPHTYQVRDYAPKLAARLGHALISDVVAIKDGAFVRQLFQGKLNASIARTGQLQLLSVQAGAFPASESQTGHAAVEDFAVQLDASSVRSRPEPPFRESARAVDLSAASEIVSVGRGIGGQDKLYVAEELAAALGAELAASRPICDNGWLPMERQVGSSGQTVAPKVYWALGISGAIQHLVGMKGSKYVVAVNKDETAPIFETADYGIVGDLFDIVPAITAEIKKAKA